MVRRSTFNREGESSILSGCTKREGDHMQIIDNIPAYGTSIEEGALAQIKTCARTAAHVALMADHHKGYAVPIGGVVAYEGAISPSGVGFDITCGNKAARLDIPAADVRARINTIMDDVF